MKIFNFLILFLFFFVSSSYAFSTEYYGKAELYFIVPCSAFQTELECTNAGCYWWNNKCNPIPFAQQKGGGLVSIIKLGTINFDINPKFVKVMTKSGKIILNYTISNYEEVPLLVYSEFNKSFLWINSKSNSTYLIKFALKSCEEKYFKIPFQIRKGGITNVTNVEVKLISLGNCPLFSVEPDYFDIRLGIGLEINKTIKVVSLEKESWLKRNLITVKIDISDPAVSSDSVLINLLPKEEKTINLRIKAEELGEKKVIIKLIFKKGNLVGVKEIPLFLKTVELGSKKIGERCYANEECESEYCESGKCIEKEKKEEKIEINYYLIVLIIFVITIAISIILIKFKGRLK